uniref:Transmembrane protein 42 n=1 Tax=Nothobranchius kadleci TaxID=1051664 RepID=A0A1A8D174_NOTKA
MLCGSLYALFAGFLGAAASLSAKLSLGPAYLQEMCDSALRGWSEGASVCGWMHVPLRFSCGGLLLCCNAVMWTMFSKALRHASSSAGATVTTTASNFICSGLLGRLVFRETHTSLWWAGISLTLCGLMVLHAAAPEQQMPQEDRKDI